MKTDPALEDLLKGSVHHTVVEFGPVETLQEAAERLGLPTGSVIKTMVVRRAAEDYIFVLVPGDRVIDWPKLRRHLGKPRLSLASAQDVETATGYQPGTITPLGSLTEWPVTADQRLQTAESVSIGTGRAGRSAVMTGAALIALLDANAADVTRPARD